INALYETFGDAEARETFAKILRCINFPLPFHTALAIDPAWLTWNGGDIARLAQAIYEGRTFNRLPLLANALEDAGCADSEILNHCRAGGKHARGCWVVELLLGLN
ncbi:MAG: hypothetical protein ACRD36_13475, partial [Candidatus Acidiferrum sp.]